MTLIAPRKLPPLTDEQVRGLAKPGPRRGADWRR